MNDNGMLDYVNACRLLVPDSDPLSVALIGCGGTGSWLAPAVVRIGRLWQEKTGKEIKLFFIDPDRVEGKNCYRQNFCEAEIGHNKAEILAWRYGLAWGMEIEAVALPVEQVRFTTDARHTMILIGCVDNAAARRKISGIAKSYGAWWLDCGNHPAAGQILVGSGKAPPADAYELQGLCTWLPLPDELHPELLEDAPEERAGTENLSCAEMALRDSQGMAINQRIAAEAADYLVRMLLTKDLVRYATYLDLASGSARSKYIVNEDGR